MNPYCLPDSLLERLLHEDSPYGDATSFALGLGAHQGELHFAARQAMTLCASEDAQRMAQMLACTVISLPAQRRPTGCRQAYPDGERRRRCAASAVQPAQTLMEYLSVGLPARSARWWTPPAPSADIGVACTRKTFPGGKAACIKACWPGAPCRTG